MFLTPGQARTRAAETMASNEVAYGALEAPDGMETPLYSATDAPAAPAPASRTRSMLAAAGMLVTVGVVGVAAYHRTSSSANTASDMSAVAPAADAFAAEDTNDGSVIGSWQREALRSSLKKVCCVPLTPPRP